MKLEKVGAEFAEVVCTVAVAVETVPICVDPLIVARENVPVNDLTEAIYDKRSDRCVEVRVIVLAAVPVDHDKPLIVRYVDEPFLRVNVWV